MKELNLYKDIMKNLPPEVKEAEAEIEKHETLTVCRTNGKDTGGQYADLRELFVRASGERTGMIYTQKLDTLPEENILQAYQNGQHSDAKRQSLNVGTEPMKWEYDAQNYVLPEQMRKYAETIETEISQSCEGIVNQEIALTRNIDTMEIVNSKGIEGRAEHISYEAAVMVTAEHNGKVTAELEVSARKLEDISPKFIADIVEKRIGENLQEIPFEGGTKECVLDASVVCNILITAWGLFSGKAYIEKKSVLAGHLGEKLFADCIRIEDRTRSDYSGFQYDIDCEGSLCSNTELVKDGVFSGLMHNLESALSMETHSTGNGGRKPMISGVVQTDIVVVPKNFTLLPGTRSQEILIKELEDGIFINQSFDVFHSINLTSGDFSIPCEGIIIKNGLPQGKARGLTMEGNLVELLRNVTEAGSEVASYTMPIIKTFAVAAPALKISKIKLSA